MNLEYVEKIANAVLYEGYILYPYRPSALKNRQRFNFGVVYPREYGLDCGEPHSMQTECLVKGNVGMTLDVRLRFLHLLSRETWQEAVEREVTLTDLLLGELLAGPRQTNFSFPALPEAPRQGGDPALHQQTIAGQLEIAAREVAPGCYKLRVYVLNLTPFASAGQTVRDDGLMGALVSTHTILSARGGEFVSLLDPPDPLRGPAALCRNIGAWPVLVGEEGALDCMLSSPIILYDYPQIAPESAGDFFDGAEIDEMLTLRVLTLTDEEKREMREGDERARRILERTEALLDEQKMKLHGVLRTLRQASGGQ